MAELCGGSGRAFEIGTLSKQAEAWVLVTMARDDAGVLTGYSFCTLERIGDAQRADRPGVDLCRLVP
ncbi:MAG: hypothetical protein R2755_16445 [Acidimicrobiales bacterium]